MNILLRPGELFLKQNNKPFFTKALKKNIVAMAKLNKIKKCNIVQIGSIMILNVGKGDNIVYLYNYLQKYLVGIANLTLAQSIKIPIKQDFESKITTELKNNFSFKSPQKFRITTKRHNKKFYYNSEEMNKIVGKLFICNWKDYLSVSLKKYDINIKIDIFDTNIYISIKNDDGINGLPVGTSQNGLLLLSGGFDSPVAGYFSLRKGIKTDFIHFYSSNTENNEKSIKEICNELKKYQPLNSVKLYLVNIDLLNSEIFCFKHKNYWIMILKYMFYKIALNIANEFNHEVLITGESLFQVSSQTVHNLNLLSEINSRIIIFRPLAAFLKLEIINIAKKINTYNISLKNCGDVCKLYNTKKQSPKLNRNIFFAESQRNIYEDIINTIIKTKIKIIDI